MRPTLQRAMAAATAPAADHVFIHRLDPDAFCNRGDLPWSGVPVTIKDNLDVAGLPTTAGSRLLWDAAPASADAEVVRRLRRAGFAILGRTNMTEFAFSGLGINPHYGTPRNPAFSGPARIPGGSSSGAAVSVALGIAPFAIGTDTGGSVRIPAAWCGVVGFKPTADTVSRAGVLPLSTTLDSVGVLASCVDDCETAFELIRDSSAAEPVGRTAATARLRLGRVRAYVDEDLDRDVQSTFDDALRALTAAGVLVQDLHIPELAGLASMHAAGTLPAAESYAWHRAYLPARSDVYDPRVLARIERGATMSSTDYRILLEARRLFIARFAARIRDVDAIVWPTVPMIAPELAGLTEAVAYDRSNLRALRNSTIVNLADGCALSLPCGHGPAPVGLTIAAGHGRDTELLRVARAIEAVLRVPPPPNAVRLRDYLTGANPPPN